MVLVGLVAAGAADVTVPAAGGPTLRRGVARASGAIALLLALIIAAVAVTSTLFVRAGNEVIGRWDPAVAGTQRILTDAIDQETGVRGYALGRDPQFLQPYRQFGRAEQVDTAFVRAKLAGDGELTARLDRLTVAIATWRTMVAQPTINGNTAAVPANTLQAKALFDTLRVRAQQLINGVRHRADAARQVRVRNGIIAVSSVGFGVLVLILTGIVIWRSLHRWVLWPVERLGAQTRVVAAGERDRRIEGEGPRELSDLGTDVEAMRLQIVSELARAEQMADELRVRGAELARSNEDLQQFAYVASHDLSEPLRKVANFCQLLERQYADQLDDRARQYIDFAVDGAKRMQALIGDLLALSRVGRTTEEFVRVDLDRALDAALATLADRIADADAVVERDGTLPVVSGDRSLLTSLLQNLVGNAVKYRREGVPPVVCIGSRHDAERRQWVFTVSDNGIGIEPQYADRIFVVFQRLHLRDQYGGTGIGLAMCRKIVEFHGGRIRLLHRKADTTDVDPPPGSTFEFTLPEERHGAQPRD